MARRLSQLAILTAAAVLNAALCAGQAQEGGGRAAAAAPTKAGEQAPVHELGGPWMLRATPENKNFYLFSFSKDGPEMTPWAQEKFKQAKASNTGAYTLDTTNDPVLTHCAPPGTPRVYFHPYPFEFVQAGALTLMMFEYDHTIRRIHTDGRPMPSDPDLTWMGTSVGRWESDQRVRGGHERLERQNVDRSRGASAQSDQLQVNERFHRIDKDHMEIIITMTDPKAFVKPWKSATFYAEQRPKWELGEISCSGDYLDFAKFEK